MAEQTRLTLSEFKHHEQDLSTLGYPLVVRDMQTIHDATQSERVKRFKRIPPIVYLRAEPSKAPNRMFSARIDQDLDKLGIDLGDVANEPRQAMAWATVRMYLEKSGVELAAVDALDPRSQTAEKFMEQDQLQDYLRRLGGKIDQGSPSVLAIPSNLFPGYPGVLPNSSFVSVQQKPGQGNSLLTMLRAVETEYEILYPEESASIAVAGIVGARNMGVFAEAWEQADMRGAQRGDSAEHAAVVAAQTLLGYGNEVFQLD